VLLGGVAALLIAAGFLLPGLEPSDEVPLLFPKDHPVQRFINYTQEQFLDEEVWRIQRETPSQTSHRPIIIVFGIDFIALFNNYDKPNPFYWEGFLYMRHDTPNATR
jgi:hypothetical protein